MNFLLYLLQVHIALTLLYIVYKAISTRNTHFTARRLLLLCILLFAVTYPLYRIPGIAATLPASLQFGLPELQITPDETTGMPAPLDPCRLAAWLYGGIALLLVLRMGVALVSVIGLRRNGTLRNHENYRIVICPGEIQPCSFFNWIFLPASAAENPAVWDKVIKHEYAHIRQVHSADILLAEGVAALCWINPVGWLLLKEVRLNLEYLADREALRDESEKKSYQYLLLDLARAERPRSSAIPFNYSFLKKRIAMINRKASSRQSLFRYLLVVPLFFLLVVGSQSCQKSPTTPQPATDSIVSSVPDDNPPGVSAEPIQETVLDAAEIMPEFPGGTTALLNFISNNLKYPQKAMDSQTEGRVVLQFVIDKEGHVTDIQILRGVTPELDQAAIDAVKNSPKWAPGMQDGEPVNVKYTLPIVFKLS